MTEQTGRQTTPRTQSRTVRFRTGAVIALAVAAGLILWLALRNTGSGSAKGTAVSPTALQSLATSVGHPIFWLGQQDANTYELTRKSDGSIIVRYLPPGVDVGAQGEYWSVATYPFAGAFQAIKNVLRGGHATRIRLAGGGLAEYDNANLNNVHVAYPGIDYQVEVFAPQGEAVALVQAGRLTSFGGPKGGSTATKPKAVSLANLTALARSLHHALYWAGPKRGYTYELTRDATGRVFIRYLPPGVQVGAKQQYLSVGTYPYPKALAGIRSAAKESGQTTIKLAGGGLALYAPANPHNVHLAYPGSDLQVEVFDPAGKARQIVASGQVTSIG